jgi:hypothetical protein
MGLRSRIKGRLKKLTGSPSTPAAPLAQAAEPPAKPAAPPPRAEPPPIPKPPVAAAKPQVATEPSVAAKPASAAPAAPGENSEKTAVDEAKIKRHRSKAERGVLKHLHKQGGTMSMKDLHDFSERRYFIAHVGFSKMMEFFVEYRYVDFDHDSYIVVLNDDGRQYMVSSVKA